MTHCYRDSCRNPVTNSQDGGCQKHRTSDLSVWHENSTYTEPRTEMNHHFFRSLGTESYFYRGRKCLSTLKKLSQRPGLALMFLTGITLLSGKPEYHEGTNDSDKTFPQLRAQKELSTMMLFKRTLVILSCAVILATSGCAAMATYWGEPPVRNQEVQATAPPETQPVQVTAEQLQQLVAPIAL